MASDAQILANRANAQFSTGPATAEGKQTSSRNATTLGLFSATAFIRPGERGMFEQFVSDFDSRLAPADPMEQTFVDQIVQAAWRLRRCNEIEQGAVEDLDDAQLERLQNSIDRARAAAQRSLNRSTAELRRLQTEGLYRATVLPTGFDDGQLGLASCRDLNPANLLREQEQIRLEEMIAEERQRSMPFYAAALAKRTQSPAPEIAKRTQSEPAAQPQIARSAPCPCGSGEKYKRCCGKDAPPLLHTAA